MPTVWHLLLLTPAYFVYREFNTECLVPKSLIVESLTCTVETLTVTNRLQLVLNCLRPCSNHLHIESLTAESLTVAYSVTFAHVLLGHCIAYGRIAYG